MSTENMWHTGRPVAAARMLGAAAALGALAWAATAGAVTVITSCPQTLAKPGETYVIDGDLTSQGTCLTVAADRITIDFRGWSIEGDGTTGAAVSDGGVSRMLTTLKNGLVGGFETGIDLAASTRSQILGMLVGGNVLDGIVSGARSLVKGSPVKGSPGTDCFVGFNDGDGISVGDFGQVQGCLVLENGVDGIRGAGHALVTGNQSFLNFGNGITVGTFGTVTFNDSSGNDVDGISVDERSLVNGNLADGNGDDGIEAVCPSTITNNGALGNGDQDYAIPPGCIFHHNE